MKILILKVGITFNFFERQIGQYKEHTIYFEKYFMISAHKKI